MPPVGFELTISAGERPQTYTLDRAATGNGNLLQLQPANLQLSLSVPLSCMREIWV
jgi:hypothetical protein